MEPEIIFEDESLMVLNKPSGWIVTDASTTGNSLTIEGWLKNLDYPISRNNALRSGIVHRLDKETSGILLVAKTALAFKDLQRQFRERIVEKEYLALVHGSLKPKEGFIKAPLGRLPWNRERFGVLPGGRDSTSEYYVTDYYSREKEIFSLVSVKPKTGRTHQIRIHLKFLKHPVVADVFYAGRKTSKTDRLWCPRLFLHAKQIKFRHPTSMKEVEFEAKIPADLAIVLSALRKIS